MGHFYTQQKGRRPSIIKDKKKKKNSAKTSLKKKPKDRWTENAKKKKKKKRMKLPERIVLHIADTTHIYTWDKWVLSAQDRSSCRGFRMANNIACCCASMGTRILLTSLVDLVTGCVRTKWLTWNHCEAKKKRKKKKENKDTDLCQILWTDLFFFPFSFQRRRPNKHGV